MRITTENWLQAQHSVLGAALIDERVVPKVMAETSEQDFTSHSRTVYNAMRKLFISGSPVDPQSVKHILGDGYTGFLVELMQIVPTAANVDHHIALCKEQAQVLALRELAQQLTEVDTTEDARQLLEKANFLMVSRQRSGSVNMTEALRSFMERMTTKVEYLPWPIEACNGRLFSRYGDYIILGAEPSVGKTAFALQCAWHWAKEMKVAFFSFETSAEKLFDRKMASLAGLHMERIKNSDFSQFDWERIAAASGDITSRTLELIPAAGYTTADIRAKIMESGYQMVVIDYLQLVSSRGSNRYEQVTNISIDLHTMAQSLNVTIMALSQLSRTDDDRTPRNSDLRESGQLEQDADIIMMLHLEKKSNPNGPRKLTVTKNKEGGLFETRLDFDGSHQIFTKALNVDPQSVSSKNSRRKSNASNDGQDFLPLPGSDADNPFP